MKLRDAYFREIPGEQQIFDYGERTDGQVEYSAHAPIDAAESSSDWVISCYRFSGDSVVKIFSLKGVWANRVTLFAGYV
jgi:hypothetical protein